MYLVDISIPDYNANVFNLQIYLHKIKRSFQKATLILFVRYDIFKSVKEKCEMQING